MILICFFLFYMKQKRSSSSSLFHFYRNRQHPTTINKLHQQKLLSLWLTQKIYQILSGLIAQLFSFLFFSDAVQRNFNPFGLAWAQQGWHNFTGLPFTSRCIAKWPPSSSASWPYLCRSQPTQCKSNYEKSGSVDQSEDAPIVQIQGWFCWYAPYDHWRSTT